MILIALGKLQKRIATHCGLWFDSIEKYHCESCEVYTDWNSGFGQSFVLELKYGWYSIICGLRMPTFNNDWVNDVCVLDSLDY